MERGIGSLEAGGGGSSLHDGTLGISGRGGQHVGTAVSGDSRFGRELLVKP